MQKIKDASDVTITPEIELANLLADDGKPLITHWYEPSVAFYSDKKDVVRNRADVDFWRIKTTGQHDFVKDKVITNNTSFTADFNLDEYTVFIVAKLGDDVASGNRMMIGFDSADNTTNAPCMGYIVGNGIAVFGLPTSRDMQIFKSMMAGDVKKLNLYTLSRSTKNGATLRINATAAGTAVTSTAKAPVTAKKIRLMGFDFATGQWQGEMGNIIICRKDLTDNIFAMQKIEQYLMAKYAIA